MEEKTSIDTVAEDGPSMRELLELAHDKIYDTYRVQMRMMGYRLDGVGVMFDDDHKRYIAVDARDRRLFRFSGKKAQERLEELIPKELVYEKNGQKTTIPVQVRYVINSELL